MRVSYSQDAGYLVRLTRAIEEDPRLGTEERREACAALSSAVATLNSISLRLLD